MLDGEFTGRDNPFGFVSDVEKDLVAVNFDNSSFDQVTVVEELQSFLDLGQEVVGGANVVHGNLPRAGGRSGGHIVGYSLQVFSQARSLRDVDRAKSPRRATLQCIRSLELRQPLVRRSIPVCADAHIHLEGHAQLGRVAHFFANQSLQCLLLPRLDLEY